MKVAVSSNFEPSKFIFNSRKKDLNTTNKWGLSPLQELMQHGVGAFETYYAPENEQEQNRRDFAKESRKLSGISAAVTRVQPAERNHTESFRPANRRETFCDVPLPPRCLLSRRGGWWVTSSVMPELKRVPSWCLCKFHQRNLALLQSLVPLMTLITVGPFGPRHCHPRVVAAPTEISLDIKAGLEEETRVLLSCVLFMSL